MMQRSTASASSKKKSKTVKENTTAGSDAVSSSDAEAGSLVSKGPNTAVAAAEKQQVRVMVRECNAIPRYYRRKRGHSERKFREENGVFISWEEAHSR